MVTSRTPNDSLFTMRKGRTGRAGIASLKLIGDAAAPGPIAWATYAGRRYAEELDQPDIGDALSFRREIAALGSDQAANAIRTPESQASAQTFPKWTARSGRHPSLTATQPISHNCRRPTDLFPRL
jgi:hypothetical protein